MMQAMIREIARAVDAAGGRALLVGGCVRDDLLGRPCGDIDCEVHGLAPDALRAILERFGEIDESGVGYGVFSLRGAGLDFALPRRETRTGPGHKDFAVAVDPSLSPAQAAQRRDFTVNAMMMDALTGERIDPFGGEDDLRAGVLRALPGPGFEEDPLRVMRGAQFAARFHLAPDAETIARMRRMDTGTLSGARVYAEMKKALLGADRPDTFFAVLREAYALAPWFAELAALVGVMQNPAHHPEGDAWTHTMLVLREAAAERARFADPLSFMLACLCHDLGKAACTARQVDGAIKFEGHEAHSVPLALQMLSRLGAKKSLLEHVENLCALHSDVHTCYYTQASEGTTNRLFDRATDPAMLCWLAICDTRGTGKERRCADAEEAFILKRLGAYEARIAAGMPDARMMMELGIRPGLQMKQALTDAREAALGGMESREACRRAREKLG